MMYDTVTYMKFLLIPFKVFYVIAGLYVMRRAYHIVIGQNSLMIRRLLYSIGGIFFCNVYMDLAWISSLLISMGDMTHSRWYLMVLVGRHIAWIIDCIQYVLLVYFFYELTQTRSFQWRRFLFITIPGFICVILKFAAICRQLRMSPESGAYGMKDLSEWCITFYVVTILCYLIVAARRSLAHSTMPSMVRQQVAAFLYYFLIPHTLLVVLITNEYIGYNIFSYWVDRYALIIVNDFLYIISLMFCMKKMLQFRFLNLYRSVQRHKPYHFVDDFKDVLLSLAQVQNIGHINESVKHFFLQAFGIVSEHIVFCVRNSVTGEVHCMSCNDTGSFDTITRAVERLLLQQGALLGSCKVLIRDDLVFDHFYDQTASTHAMIEFLDMISADLFLPIYEQAHMIGYIIVARNARPHELFSHIERDEMVLFANYLGAIIHLLQHRNLREIVQQKHALESVLNTKYREIEHYKESIKVLLQGHADRAIGVGWYARRKGLMVNRVLRDMVALGDGAGDDSVDILALKRLCAEVDRYGIDRSAMIQTMQGRILHCVATSHEDRSHVVITAYYADTAERCSIPFQELHDLSSWEYALYMQATGSGLLINKVIPGNTPALLNFKIALLKSALRNQALLLDLPADDRDTMVTMLHSLSLRQRLHTIDFIVPEQFYETSGQLFGFDSAPQEPTTEPLLRLLNDVGTLCINRIEYMSRDAQERLAELLTTGTFRPFFNNRFIQSNVRIICTTQVSLKDLVEKQLFSERLFAILQNGLLTLPSLSDLDRNELMNLMHQLAAQHIGASGVSPALSLTSRDIDLIMNQPVSIFTLHERVAAAIQAKLMNKKTDQGMGRFADSSMSANMVYAARLGRRALNNRELLLSLWNQLKSQAKIAALLNVHRSSVNRRCKEFNIDVDCAGENN